VHGVVAQFGQARHHILFALAQSLFALMRPVQTHQSVVTADAHRIVRDYKVKPERIEGLLAGPCVGSAMVSDEVRTTALQGGFNRSMQHTDDCVCRRSAADVAQ